MPDGSIGTNWWDAGPRMGWADHAAFAITAPGTVPQIPPDAAATINSLATAGIDFSVAVSDLADWLSNPDFTPYPAIAEALLRLLGGHRLKRLVFIDVITFDYEHTHGIASPRKAADVNTGVLKNAVLKAFNERYGGSAHDFQSLIT
jgi:hypothetical protein